MLNLPIGYPRGKIELNFKRYGEIIDISEESFKIEGTNIEVGSNIPRFKLEFKKENAANIDKLKGIKSINNIRFLITVVGEKTPCFLCNDLGHWKKDCPKLKIKCEKCNKIGHTEDECSDAKKLFKSNIEILEDFNINDEDLVDNIEAADTAAITNTTFINNKTSINDNLILDSTPQAPRTLILNKINLNKDKIIEKSNDKNGKIRDKKKLTRKRSNSSPSDIQPGKKINQKWKNKVVEVNMNRI